MKITTGQTMSDFEGMTDFEAFRLWGERTEYHFQALKDFLAREYEVDSYEHYCFE